MRIFLSNKPIALCTIAIGLGNIGIFLNNRWIVLCEMASAQKWGTTDKEIYVFCLSMEPITVTAAAVLSYALPKLLDASLAKIGESLTEGSLSHTKQLGGQLLQKIRNHFQGHSEATKVLTAAEQGSKEDLQKLENYLQRVLEREPEFLKELQPIVQEIEQIIKIEAPSAGNIQQVSGGQALQVNDPQAPVIQARDGNTFNF